MATVHTLSSSSSSASELDYEPANRGEQEVKEEMAVSDACSSDSEWSGRRDEVSSDEDDDEEEEEEALSGHCCRVQSWKTGTERVMRGSQFRKRAAGGAHGKTLPRVRNSNPGRKVVGGRIYDSKLGKTCHWCRQKTVELHVECSHCPIRFCGACLLNRNGEIAKEEVLVQWTCPKCRRGCGKGCKNCCNCGPCRKAQGFAPTGQAINVARKAGFNNVHDYLVHLKTGETPDALALRKNGKGWTRATGAGVRSYYKNLSAKKEVEDEAEIPEEYEVLCPDENEVEDEEEAPEEDEQEDEEKAPVAGDDNAPVENLEDEEEAFMKDEMRNRDKGSVPCKVNKAPEVSGSFAGKDKIPFSGSVDKTSDSCPMENVSEEPQQMDEIIDEPVLKKGCVRSLMTKSALNQDNDFDRELADILRRPFSSSELADLSNQFSFRKPQMKLRQVRSRTFEVPSDLVGLSFEDHYKDLADLLQLAVKKDEKLFLLRGFFFWIQHSCTEGAHKPWIVRLEDDADCTEIDGSDCVITKERVALDEDALPKCSYRRLVRVKREAPDLSSSHFPPLKAVKVEKIE